MVSFVLLSEDENLTAAPSPTEQYVDSNRRLKWSVMSSIVKRSFKILLPLPYTAISCKMLIAKGKLTWQIRLLEA